MKMFLTTLAACVLLAGCATDTTAESGEKAARETAYAPTGTLIPRKNGQGLGAAPITAVDRNAVENARNTQGGYGVSNP